MSLEGRPDRWFFIGPYDLEPAEFTPVYRWLDRFWLEVFPPPGWTRVSFDSPIYVVHVNGGNQFALEALQRLLDAEHGVEVAA